MILNFNCINRFLALHTFDCKKQYDLILVLGSANPYIVLDGYSLYKEGHSAFFMISGGVGHTTDYMKSVITENIQKDRLSESAILKNLIEYYNKKDNSIIIEEQSTNCGENILFSINEILNKNIDLKNILLIHDPLMQRRIDLTAKKLFPSIHFDNYSCFIPEVFMKEEKYFIKQNYRGLWSFDKYLNLLLGEMKSVLDNEEGYGPKGKKFIEHICIPSDVLIAYKKVLEMYKNEQRL